MYMHVRMCACTCYMHVHVCDSDTLATLARYVAVPAVPKVTSLRPLQNRKINSQYRVWVLKSPHHAHPKAPPALAVSGAQL